MVAEGGWRLMDHAAARRTEDALLEMKWDYVVLQEQSQIPSVEQLRMELMYPAARTLARRIREEGAEPVLFMTWGHRDGWPERGLKDYASMQAEIRRGYRSIASELEAPVAAVGEAWAAVREQHPTINLWEPDGSHPSPAGTYLAACAFYATLFGESPEGLTYRAGLSRDVAHTLQMIAAEVVLSAAVAKAKT